MKTPPDIHPAARTGFAEASSSYTRGRPEYPGELVEWLRDRVGLGPNATALELGAGTGKFTRTLLLTGARVIAVEPVGEMRDLLVAALPEVLALEGSAQAIPVASESVEAIVCAQSFHWFATREALTEFHRVLKPGGALALVWNIPDESVPWVAAMQRILFRYDQDCPEQFRHGNWRKVFPDARFTDLVLSELTHTHTGRPEQIILERAQSLSYIANLPAQSRAGVGEELRTLIESDPDLRGREEIAFPYRTQTYVCRKS